MEKGNKVCPECKIEFKPKRGWMKFCSEKCRNICHNREKLCGVQLLPEIRDKAGELAREWGTSITHVVNTMLWKMMNPDGRPIEEPDK